MPAEWVIKEFGGAYRLAKAVGVTPMSVYNWKKTGLIPAKAQQHILRVASKRKLDICPDDLVRGRRRSEKDRQRDY